MYPARDEDLKQIQDDEIWRIYNFLDMYIPDGSGVVGWCDGAGQTSSIGASYNLDYSRARAYCVAVGAGGGCLGIFTLINPFFPLSRSLWKTA